MNKKHKLCFLIQAKQHYSKLLNVANILEHEFNITFLIDTAHFTLDNASYHPSYEYKKFYTSNTNSEPSTPRRNKINYMLFKALAHIYKALSPIKNAILASPCLYIIIHKARRYAASTLNIIKRSPISYIVSFLRFLKNFYKVPLYKIVIAQINLFFSTNKFDCLILAEANVEYLSEAFIKGARRHHIPSIIIPYTFCLPSEPARHYYDEPFHAYRWYHKFFIPSKWVYKYDGRKLIRMYTYQIVSMHKLKISPPRPWIQESSTADALVVESDMMKEHYLKCKLPKKQLRIIGDEAHDQLFSIMSNKDELKHKILKEANFNNLSKKIITFAIFPDFMYKYASSTGFKQYSELLKFICEQLATLNGYNIVLCLHPSLKKENFKFLETKTIRVSSRKTIELVAISDLYVASISATIRWAIALGIPVINYDCYQMRYDDFNHVGGVLNVETKEDFIKAVDKVKNDNSYLKSLALKQKSEMHKYGIIDGKFGKRLKNLIKEYKHK